jgi:hypothetical protein
VVQTVLLEWGAMPTATTRFPLRAFLLCCAPAIAACAGEPLRPYVFRGVVPQGRATAALAAALTEVGRTPSFVDPRAGVIVTSWADSGYRFHEAPIFPDDLNGPIEKLLFRRYHVAVLASQPGSMVTVRLQAEVKRCLPPVSLVREQLIGLCEDSRLGFRSLQRDLDHLGETVRDLATAPPSRGTVQ